MEYSEQPKRDEGLSSDEAHLVRTLGLRLEYSESGDERYLVGLCEDYPCKLLSEMRLWIEFHFADASELTFKEIDWTGKVREILIDRPGSVILSPRRCVIELGHEMTQPVEVLLGIMSDFAESLRQSGITSTPGVCNYCGTNQSMPVGLFDDQLAQICESCLNGRKELRAEQEKPEHWGIVSAAALVGLGCVGAWLLGILWFFLWTLISYFELRSWTSWLITLPLQVFLMLLGGLLLLMANPIGWLMRLIRRRRKFPIGVLAGMFVVAGVMLGECFLAAPLPKRSFIVVIQTPGELLQHWTSYNIVDVLGRALVGFLCVCFAWTTSQPDYNPVKL